MRTFKNFTADKFEFMLEIGLSLEGTYNSGFLYQLNPMNLITLFTGGIQIDESIKILQLIKKHQT